jgi:tetratricopeptide (TPR) repeat protein
MASKRFNAAVEEVTAALTIHPRYMKAILRRARCYSRLQMIQEGIAEYKRWLELVEEASKPNYVASMSLACLFDGPNEVKSSEVTQVKKELDELYKAKRRNEAASLEEADRRREREKWQENFTSSWRYGNDAQQRRDQWHEQQDSTRRWDSFKTEGPRSQSQGRSRSQNEGSSHSSSGHHRSLSNTRSEQILDYYSILNVTATAKMEDIKKAFRKLAVKYHPDKNKDVSATEIFLRIKLAHDTLTDPVKRMQYDTDLRRNGKL